MVSNFKDLIDEAIKLPMQKVAVVCGDDEDTIEAIEKAVKNKVAYAIMVGDEEATRSLAKEKGIDPELFEYVNEKNRKKAASLAVKLIKDKKAQIIMKGFISTSYYARAILNKDFGLLPKKAVMSHVTCMGVKKYPKLLFLSDVAIIPLPDLMQKVQMINYAVEVARLTGIEKPKVAVISASEKVEIKIQSAVDAAILSKMAERGQIKNCIVDGPLALDIAISKHCLKGKKIKSPVNAEADIIIFPSVEAGNSFYKGMIHFADAEIAAIITGTEVPAVLVSRTDSDVTKFNSIALAVYYAAKKVEKI